MEEATATFHSPTQEVTELGNSLDDYEVIQFLGKGAHSEVFEVVHKIDGHKYALKVINKDHLSKQQVRRRLMNEIEIHLQLSHKYIVELHHFFEDDTNVYLLTELCKGGELYQYVKTRSRLTEREAREIFKMLLQGIEYIHCQGIIHRDLKLGNILLTDDNQVKLCDFGLALRVDDMDLEGKRICGTPNYIAPEVIMKQPYDQAADMWAIGCILFTCLVGHPPFETNDVKETLSKATKGIYQIPPYISSNSRDLIDSLLQINPQNRITIDDTFMHPFLNFANPNEETIVNLSILPTDDSVQRSSTETTSTGYGSQHQTMINTSRHTLTASSKLSEEKGEDVSPRRQSQLKHWKIKRNLNQVFVTEHLTDNNTKPKKSHDQSENLPCFLDILAKDNEHPLPSPSLKSLENARENSTTTTKRLKTPTNLLSPRTLQKLRQTESHHFSIPDTSTDTPTPNRFKRAKQLQSALNDENHSKHIHSNPLLSNMRDSLELTRQQRTPKNLASKSVTMTPTPKKKPGNSQISPQKAQMLSMTSSMGRMSPFGEVKRGRNLQIVIPVDSEGLEECGCDTSRTEASELRNSASFVATPKSHTASVLVKSIDIKALSTSGLHPILHKTKRGYCEITEEGWVLIEFSKKKRMFAVSPNGQEVVVQSQSGKKTFRFENLPSKYYESYMYCHDFVNTVKMKTPKIIFETKVSKSLLMCDEPSPHFEVEFHNGITAVHQVGSEVITIHTPQGDIIEHQTSEECPDSDPALRAVVNHVSICLSKCKAFGDKISDAMQSCDDVSVQLPIILYDRTV